MMRTKSSCEHSSRTRNFNNPQARDLSFKAVAKDLRAASCERAQLVRMLSFSSLDERISGNSALEFSDMCCLAFSTPKRPDFATKEFYRSKSASIDHAFELLCERPGPGLESRSRMLWAVWAQSPNPTANTNRY